MFKVQNKIGLNIIKSYEDYADGGDIESRMVDCGDVLEGENIKSYSHFCDVKLKEGKIAVGIPVRFLEKIS